MLEKDPRRLKKRLSVQEKLEILGITEEDLFDFLEAVGANYLQAPYLKWKYQAEAESFGASGFSAEKWRHRSRFPPKITDLLDHLLGRNKVLSVRREWDFNQGTIKLATALIFDIDVHDSEQAKTLSARVAAVHRLFPWLMFEFVNSESDSRQIAIPVDFPDDLRAVPSQTTNEYVISHEVFDWEPDWGGVLHLQGQIDVEDIMVERRYLILADQVRDDLDTVRRIGNELKRIGLVDIEIWPRPLIPLRLPAGPESYLLTDEYPIEGPSEMIKAVIGAYRPVRNSLPSLQQILYHLGAQPEDANLRRSTARPVGQKRPSRRKSKPTNELQQIINDGLIEYSTRADICLKLIRYWAPECASPAELAERVWSWFEIHHNGNSRMYNRRPEMVRNWIIDAAQNWWQKVDRSGSPAVHNRLREKDLENLFKMIPQPEKFTTKSLQSLGATLRCAADLLRYTKARRKNSGGSNEHRVEIPQMTWSSFSGTTEKSANSPSYYANRISQFIDCGLLSITNGTVQQGRCREYAIHFLFDEASPIIPHTDEAIHHLLVRMAESAGVKPPKKFSRQKSTGETDVDECTK